MHPRCYPPQELLYDTLSARRKRRRERRRNQSQISRGPSSLPHLDLREAQHVRRLAYSRRQAAEALGVSIATVDRRLVPTVRTVKTPWGQRLIPVDELERFIAEHVEQPRPRPAARPTGRPVVLPTAVVDRIYDEHQSGKSFGEIARGLTREGVPTAHGGRRWWPSTIRAVLAAQPR
jgi:recombinase